MVSTRSMIMASPEGTEISEGVKQYLDSIIEVLKLELTNLRVSVESKNKQIADLKTTTDDLKEAIVNLRGTVAAKNKQITDLNVKVTDSIRRNVQLASKVSDINESLSTRIDDLEQYGRKSSLRVEGIEVSPGETNAALTEKVEHALNALGAKVNSSDFVRLHRSGRPHKAKDGRQVAQCIVRFRNWNARSRAYDTHFDGSFEERKKKPYFVRLDLTKRRLDLLKKAQNLFEHHPTAHALADSECRLLVKNRETGAKNFFNTPAELNDIIAAMGGPSAAVSSTRRDSFDDKGHDDEDMAPRFAHVAR